MELKPITQIQFDAIASSHGLWLASGQKDGQCADFSDTMLRECEISAKNLKGSSFRNADLSGMMIRDVNFDDCDFTCANMSGSSLEKVSAQNADFSNANLHRLNQCSPGNREVNLAGAIFKDTRLTELFLHSFILNGATFFQADLSLARLIYCRLPGAKFTNCSMKGADFRFAELDEVDFSGSDLTGSIFMESLPDSIVWADAKFDAMRKIQGGGVTGTRLDHGKDALGVGEKQPERQTVAS